jgi:hypothetical protein
MQQDDPQTLALDICGDREIRNAQDLDVTRALREAAECDPGYVILGRAEDEYVQTAAGIVAYREQGRHYRSVQDPVDPDAIEATFLAYLRGDPAWRARLEWTDVTDELAQLRGGSSHWILIVALMLLAITAALWYSRY